MSVGNIPLHEVRLQRVRPDEVRRWNAFTRVHRYSRFCTMCGSRLCHVTALHCAFRDRCIGWPSL